MEVAGLADMCLELWEILSSSWPSSALLVPTNGAAPAVSSYTCCAADSLRSLIFTSDLFNIRFYVQDTEAAQTHRRVGGVCQSCGGTSAITDG